MERHLIRDYRTLHTRFNPFRFRASVVRVAHRAMGDALGVRALAEGAVREGRCADLAAGERAVRADLAQILAVFEGVDAHLDAVDAVVVRLERRIGATLRYAEAPDPGTTERIAALLQAAGESDEAPDVLADLSLLRPPIGEAHFQTPRARRSEIFIEALPDLNIDPAVDAFAAAKADFRRRVTVTPERVRDFVDAKLSGGAPLRGSAIAIADVDDFVVFQRLREIDLLFEGQLAESYAVTHLTERLVNDWLDCPDFIVERRKGARPCLNPSAPSSTATSPLPPAAAPLTRRS